MGKETIFFLLYTCNFYESIFKLCFPNKCWRRIKIISIERIETEKNKPNVFCFLEVKVNESLKKIILGSRYTQVQAIRCDVEG